MRGRGGVDLRFISPTGVVVVRLWLPYHTWDEHATNRVAATLFVYSDRQD